MKTGNDIQSKSPCVDQSPLYLDREDQNIPVLFDQQLLELMQAVKINKKITKNSPEFRIKAGTKHQPGPEK